MNIDPEETEKLTARAQAGDAAAFEELFARHRRRLRQAIALRMDSRIAARLDASDILQETYLEATRRLPALPRAPDHAVLSVAALDCA